MRGPGLDKVDLIYVVVFILYQEGLFVNRIVIKIWLPHNWVKIGS